MNIPTIGGARGIFEFFVPGIFLLLNFALATYHFPSIDAETKKGILDLASNSGLAVLIGVTFGYLLGVVLRLFKTDFPDRLSAALLRVIDPTAKKKDRNFELWATEHFPYFGWIEQICRRYLPGEALTFYEKTWGQRKQGEQNKQFFTHIKTIINSNDARATEEMYAAESMSRYIAGMFYALGFSFIALLATVITYYRAYGELLVGLVIILTAYFLIIAVILGNYRFIRIKEVEIVFAASFRNRALFEEGMPLGKEVATQSLKKQSSRAKKSA
jgi:hypothetical protein